MFWYSHLFQNFSQFIVVHTIKGFGILNNIDVFLELSCFFHDPVNVGNLISGSSAFSKTSLDIWKSLVHIMLKTNMPDFACCSDCSLPGSSAWDFPGKSTGVGCHCLLCIYHLVYKYSSAWTVETGPRDIMDKAKTAQSLGCSQPRKGLRCLRITSQMWLQLQ